MLHDKDSGCTEFCSYIGFILKKKKNIKKSIMDLTVFNWLLSASYSELFQMPLLIRAGLLSED